MLIYNCLLSFTKKVGAYPPRLVASSSYPNNINIAQHVPSGVLTFTATFDMPILQNTKQAFIRIAARSNDQVVTQIDASNATIATVSGNTLTFSVPLTNMTYNETYYVTFDTG
jgi:hypothetical protein